LSSFNIHLDGFDVEKVVSDIADGDSMRNALKSCDTLFYVAAHSYHWVLDNKEPYRVNVGGTRTTLQAAMDAGI